jgi:hypothetical protein
MNTSDTITSHKIRCYSTKRTFQKKNRYALAEKWFQQRKLFVKPITLQPLPIKNTTYDDFDFNFEIPTYDDFHYISPDD